MGKKQIFLHVGGHRTGTSSFQLALHENRQLLADHGIDAAYPGRDGIPTGDLALGLPALRHGTEQTAKFAVRVGRKVNQHSPDPDRDLLMSEENIIGPMIHFYKGQFYPAARARFIALKAGLEACHIARVLLVIRSYDALYVSSFRKRAEDRLSDPFSDSVDNMMGMDRGWPGVIGDLQNVLKPEALTVIDYAARGSSTDLLHHLVPQIAKSEMKDLERTLNLSATDAALIELQERYAQDEKLTREDWKEVIARHADDTADKGFASFSKAQAAKLQNQYAADLDEIADMPGLTLIR